MRFRRTNKAFIDWFSLIHIGSGLLIGIVMKLGYYKFGWFGETKVYILTGLLVIILWEIFEITLRYIKKYYRKTSKFLLKFLPGHVFLREGEINIFSDVIFGICGLLLVYLLL